MERTLEINLLTTKIGAEGEVALLPPFSQNISFGTLAKIDYSSIEFYYDQKLGSLNIITDYGEFNLQGFITPSEIGTGKRGRRGKRGNDGADGKTGREGRKGRDGCAGIPGLDGIEGNEGLDGEDGVRGQQGIFGCSGVKGIDGNMGAVGPDGPDGARGSAGSNCIIGPTGPIGKTPYSYVVVSDVAPTDDLVYLWALPVKENVAPVLPIPPTPMNGKINSVVVQLTATGGAFYQGIGAFVLSEFSGGVGPFKYQWSGTYSAKPELEVFETGTVSKNFNLKCRVNIPTGTTKKIDGSVTLTITDLGNNSNTLVLNGTFNFSGTNQSTGGGAGGGCFIYGSLITLNDNTSKPIQEIFEGDDLKGLDIKGLPDSSFDTAFLKWYTDNLQADLCDVYVSNVRHSTFNNYVVVNDILKATVDENIFVRRENIWAFIRMKDIKIGDYLYHVSGEFHLVDKIDRVIGYCDTVSLNVEMVDTFFVDGYLVHNADNDFPIHKN